MEGRNRVLKIDCRDCVYGISIEDSAECMGRIISILCQEPGIDVIVLSEIMEREYDKNQTNLVKEFAAIYEETKGWRLKSKNMPRCKRCMEKRESELNDILDKKDPILSYFSLISYQRKQKRKPIDPKCFECMRFFLEDLQEIKNIFESSRAIAQTERKFAKDRKIYKKFFSPLIRPYFSTSRIQLEPPLECTLVSAYKVKDTHVRIYLPKNKPEYIYFLSPPEFHLDSDEFEIINAAREEMLNQQPESLDFTDPKKSKEYFKRLAKIAISKARAKLKKDINKKRIQELAEIISKYTAGMGILETILEDPNVQDIYINAPSDEAPLCIHHSEVEDCVTNVYLTESDVEAMISRFRARSGRAFSEAEPALDLELPEYGTRVVAIGKPFSPDGIAFALRRQKPTPWTLPQFIDNGMITAQAAGLLSFLIDGQATILVTGSRGSGKTSLLISLLGELMQKLRIITIEDTLEIPVPQFNALGYRIQRLKIQSSVGKSETELTPQEALATALRLGESVLVIGEVRGPETKILYESMRIGAAGNSVLGTIHGSSTSSVFERVVYDIGIPATSFKATDIVITAAPIRKGGGIRRFRRIVQISEVKKDWYSENPNPKEVFRDLMVYDPSKDMLETTVGYSASETISAIAKKWNLTYKQALENIDIRAKMKECMVKLKRKKKLLGILELEHVIECNNKFRELMEEHSDYYFVYQEWEDWFNRYAERMV
jgi:type IV secretory pathway ATPase VirB11/archaellum biosynthesis ATPase